MRKWVVYMVVCFVVLIAGIEVSMSSKKDCVKESSLESMIRDTESSSISVVRQYGYPYCLGGHLPANEAKP